MATGTTVPVTLPQMGESVAEGTVLEWLKQPGDSVEEGEDLVVISTDKVDAEIPAPASGILSAVHAQEGDTVQSGSVVGEIDPSGDASSGGDDAPAASSDDGAADAGAGELVDVIAPSGGESVTEATLLEWLVQPGDAVEEGQDLVVISTDKVDMELPAPTAGVLEEQLFADGDTIHPLDVIGRVRAGAPSGGASNGSAAPPAAEEAPAASANGNGNGAVPAGVSASPVAARVASAEGVDLANVTGSGPRGRILKDDVLGAKANGGRSARQASRTTLRGGANALASGMEESLSTPTATSFRTITITTLDGRRKQLKGAGKKVSFTHLIGYAIARAATEVMPVMAHTFERDDEGNAVLVDHGQVNLGIAVDVERRGKRTLMVPVIKDAGRLGFDGFLDAFNDLIARARDNKLTPEDLQGANVQLTNPGGIGTVASVPRLMTGNGTIVATGSIAYPVGLGEVGELIGAEKVMTMTSTYDHRIIQGAQSGEFLKVVEEFLQGEHEFYEQAFADLGADLGPAIEKPQPKLSAFGAGAGAAATTAGLDPTRSAPSLELLQAVQAATSLVRAIRSHGHLVAKLDPLNPEDDGDPIEVARRIGIDTEKLGLTKELLGQVPAKILRTFVEGETLADVLPALRDTYSGTVAYEVEHITDNEQRVWLREAIESGEYRKPLSPESKKQLLNRLIQVDQFERFMQKAYLGQKRFSIEGLDVTVPVIDELIQLAGSRAGAQEVVIGMAHRGRLNVLAHNLGRPYDALFTEFEGGSVIAAAKTVTQELQGGTGDVKYHHGASGRYDLPDGKSVGVVLESNPSHLEFVNPVVAGAARAAQTDRGQPSGPRDEDVALPIILHGDAAFPGQGVVAETLNLQALEGYKVGGTVHLILNNQVGFTTEPSDSRSTQWSSDLAKGFDVPIIHVNADDVEACITAARLAFAFRQKFGHDVLIDLIGYRRYGHNESDEPAYTQPLMAETIKGHPRVSELYAKRLDEEGVLPQAEADAARKAFNDHLVELHGEVKRKVKEWQEAGGSIDTSATGTYLMDRSRSEEPVTKVAADDLRELNEQLLRTPETFTVNAKLARQLEKRRDALGEAGGIEWAHAEALAYASLVTEGIPVRLTGQDAERGTFSQRHLVLHDSKDGSTFTPIQHLDAAQAPMELYNSPLSEVACLGFEYGYSQEAPEALVLWEAQFGDFVNGAQVIVDQFIVSGLAKWGQTSRLTMLLPHGYEGAGPEHSSGRVERFLQLAAEGNIRVANLTTPAQYFHLLRRQALIEKARPLIVMTPKSLLRLPQARNRIEHLSETKFFPVLGEPGVDPAAVTRLILCTGKVFYDLKGHELREDNPQVAIGRVELLYPFPEEHLRDLINAYPNLREVVWVQEEPRNMGARAYMSPRLQQILPDHLALGYVGRPERASPGEGYPAAHTIEQNRIVKTALDVSVPVSQFPKRSPGNR
ncbi:multifunctional oxoglutarate decarboxylase/oxoglutarate dehydrogenase thiamine pyrophosphate-binding subunit/dihydrolipoyllysine-residue succinyltransferase subunit [Patulibacter brassicae]|uniref:Multifunctional oxoglutarate decarboxylase/oxoglutarate dehydrogenase thiamine pyrophosphate-binding subunit/dihydrolipoyllysine-residue succinyltransferase subunit n=1 Tax=Patulibacter brassicae TaxID=1705717 RepID=A0ABU4VJU8_9ACTN|nr:multifunctional oxoglutarate decarboxylase/oxoglutarate dehydrogenase thiamine pyrophosphate-binding subunit/dihydrolipoyllysine-residue succinyltransferase subunit [Patulibacter brassicae]MDX8151964.1 multifunctional oxoglutarate decarboxylase/oxoglutarate dehydrogenase thiamine pyrophosphate-binding subunit/dihydrolipoyllysine-residue succinyltransferase subunit [Patulibacter brassicae]